MHAGRGPPLRRAVPGRAGAEGPLRVALVVLANLLPAAAYAQSPNARGPLETRDEFLLAQTRLALPAVSPRALAAGETVLRLDLDWGNDFGLVPRAGGRLLVDGEHRTLALEVRRGLTPSLSLGARLPLRWRGGGVLDGVIDWWHGLLGLPSGGRELVRDGGFAVEGSEAVAWSGRPGTGLGRLELSAHWTATRRPSAWTSAVVGRVALPTATGTFPDAGWDVGGQALLARPLGTRWDVYLGAGAVVVSRREVEGIAYRRGRGQGFAAVEWRPARPLSLLGEVALSSRLVTRPAGLPGAPAYLRLGAKLEVARAWTLEGGFVEGIHGLVATTDFGVMLGLTRRLSPPQRVTTSWRDMPRCAWSPTGQ